MLGLAWLPNPRFETTSLAPQDLPRDLILLGLVGLMDLWVLKTSSGVEGRGELAKLAQ